MEKVLGPFNGYFAVVQVCEVEGAGGGFLASYKICGAAPADYWSAVALRQKSVAGLLDSVDEAIDIAVQLARLQMAGLPARSDGAAEDSRPSVPPMAPQGSRLYAPTLPGPL